MTYVFDNNTGNIVQSCTGLTQSTLVEGLDLAASGAACTSIDAYLMSGFVRFDSGNSPSGAEPTNSSLARYATLPLDASAPLLLDTSNTPTPNLGGTPTMTCYSQRQQVVSTSATSPVTITGVSLSGGTVTVTAVGHTFVVGQTVAINGVSNAAFDGAFVVTGVPMPALSFTFTLPPPLPPTGTTANLGTAARVARLTIAEGTSVALYTGLVSRFVVYACIVTPVDHDTVATTAKRWWGRVTLNPNTVSAAGTVWAISSSGSDYQICRYSADFNGNAAIANSEHPQWYRGVTGALDSQNYLVVQGQACPTDKAANPLGSPATYADNTTADHQPNGERSFQCPAGGCGSKNPLEPPATDTDIFMD